MRQQLRAVDPDPALTRLIHLPERSAESGEASAAETAALEQAQNETADLMQAALEEVAANRDLQSDAPADAAAPAIDMSNKALIKRTRKSFADKLVGLGQRQEALQVRSAAVKAAFDKAIEDAQAIFDAAMKDIQADLYQITQVKDAVTLAHGKLVEAEA